MTKLTLVSHALCPYVQRAAIALAEKGVPFARREIDLARKPGWFRRISPTDKVPLLLIGQGGTETVLFESAAILEYLEDSFEPRLHPANALERARHRAWIEFGSGVLNAIAVYYNAPDPKSLTEAAGKLREQFLRVEAALGEGPWFAGSEFSLVDAAFGPVFRYFDVFDQADEHRILTGLPRVAEWRATLRERPSIRGAVAPDYPERLARFLVTRRSAISTRCAG